MNTQIQAPVAHKFLIEFLDLILAGATENEAILQIAQSNGLSIPEVIGRVEQAKELAKLG